MAGAGRLFFRGVIRFGQQTAEGSFRGVRNHKRLVHIPMQVKPARVKNSFFSGPARIFFYICAPELIVCCRTCNEVLI